MLHGIAATAANAYDLYHCVLRCAIDYLKHRHLLLVLEVVAKPVPYAVKRAALLAALFFSAFLFSL
jgi:hypothetical protein